MGGFENVAPEVSIGMPVYNGGRFVEAALRSILNQTYQNFELIIADNASTDRTQEICARYAREDRRIRYVRNRQNLGAARNYNLLVHLATGRFFKWAACDDLLAPDFLAKCVERLRTEPDAVLAYSRTQLIDEYGRPLPAGTSELDLDVPDPVRRFSLCLDPMELWENPVFGVIRREALLRTRLIGQYLAADRCLMAELSLMGRFARVPERLFYRRVHPRNIGTEKRHLSFYRPGAVQKLVLPEWRVLWEHWKTVLRSRLDPRTKMKLAGVLTAWMVRRAPLLGAQLGVAVREALVAAFRQCAPMRYRKSRREIVPRAEQGTPVNPEP